MMTKYLRGVLGDAGIILLATALAYGAHLSHRPITAVLLHLVGVILVSARSGQFHGVIAAGVSFVAFSFLTEPAFLFSYPTADTIVPLFAFLLSALGAGWLVGRLRDNVSIAMSAERRKVFLLAISERLQRVLRVDEIEAEVRNHLPYEGLANIRLYVSRGTDLVRPSRDNSTITEIAELMPSDFESSGIRKFTYLELPGSTNPIGMLKLTRTSLDPDEEELRSIAAFIALAVERCLLLERLNEVEAAERTEQLKDTILSSISHDLRTPLTAIEAAASALIAPELDIAVFDRRKLLESIVSQCERLNRYTGDLLNVGRIQAGISPKNFETVEVGEILAVALQNARELGGDVRFVKSIPSRPIFVSANASMLQQAMFNLLDNAAKHGGEGGTVSASVDCIDDQVRICIEDDGPGIPPNEQHRIFERFYRVGTSGDRVGSGLGLYIAKGFVEAFGGQLDVVSPILKKRGTRICIHLPKLRSKVAGDLERLP